MVQAGRGRTAPCRFAFEPNTSGVRVYDFVKSQFPPAAAPTMRSSTLPMPADSRRLVLAWTVFAAGTSLLLAGSAQRLEAQSAFTPKRASELTIVAGIGQRRQLDVTASPLVFGGAGLNGAARLTRPVGAS